MQFGSAGAGSTGFIDCALFNAAIGVSITHVPYRGGGPAMNDVIGGQVPIMFGTVLETLPHARSGRLRALAVSSAQRAAFAPDLPTIAEAALPGYDVTGWYAFLAPAATPRAIVAKLNAGMTVILAAPATRDRFLALGADPWPTTTEAAQSFIAVETARWAKVIAQAGLKAE
jgi:tripartite-type tricarboxylate transporter receptor subunit TctC